ncbi:MAG TPA: cytochrome P450 [Acidimicrobiales bacterium]|nr:cytochrome P450 [Acidimicrobiales bacterium]
MDDVDLNCPAAQADPDAYFHRLRSEHGPVVWSEAHRGWLVIGHEAVATGFRHPGLSSDRTAAFDAAAGRNPPAFQRVVELLRGWMVFRDPPAHTRLREPVRAAFTPARVGSLAPAIAAMADSLLDEAGDGAWDFRAGFARPLPAMVIAELLGVPAGDRVRFQSWSDQLSLVVFTVDSRGAGSEAATQAAIAFGEYFGDLLEGYRQAPADNLLSALAGAVGPDLSAGDLVGAATLLLFAGHETTTTLLANAVWCLAAHPGVRSALTADPGRWPDAVEELMRLAGPAKSMARKVSEPFEWEGHRLRRGDTVFLCIGAANRDPAVFAEPDRMDLDRHPNPHMGFGWGLHHCLGAALARMEAAVALRRVYERWPGLAPVGDGPEWAGGVLGRAARSVVVQPA